MVTVTVVNEKRLCSGEVTEFRLGLPCGDGVAELADVCQRGKPRAWNFVKMAYVSWYGECF